jgi:hypothetical protein
MDLSGAPSEAERDAWIAEHRQRLENGDRDLHLYSTVNTNVLLSRLSGMPEVEKIAFESTIDLDSEGLKHLKAFPNLRSLSFYCERSVNDSTFQYICDCPELERLSLTFTGLTGTGLASITQLASLEYLNVEPGDDAVQCPDEYIMMIAELPAIKKVHLHGWSSDKAIAELVRRLPDCEVTNNSPGGDQAELTDEREPE